LQGNDENFVSDAEEFGDEFGRGGGACQVVDGGAGEERT